MHNLNNEEVVILAEVLECLRCLKNIPDMVAELKHNNKLMNELIEAIYEVRDFSNDERRSR